jgi:ketosteroid isomerase-like protein
MRGVFTVAQSFGFARIAAVLVAAMGISACQRAEAAFEADAIIAMERAALDRWGKGDPQGYVEIMAADITYFDPVHEKRVDGLAAIKEMLAPITGKISVSRYDMIAPKVQHHGDVALLTFNLISYQRQADGSEKAVARWNSTETYARVADDWRIIHSHWSFITPELKQQVSEVNSQN